MRKFRFEVVLLHSGKRGSITKDPETNLLYLTNAVTDPDLPHYELFILDNRTPKVGEYFFPKDGSPVHQLDCNEKVCSGDKVVIACNAGYKGTYYIPKSFIEEYCKNPVKEVMLEITDYYRPYYNSKKEVHISKVPKEDFTRKEVISLLGEMRSETVDGKVQLSTIIDDWLYKKENK